MQREAEKLVVKKIGIKIDASKDTQKFKSKGLKDM